MDIAIQFLKKMDRKQDEMLVKEDKALDMQEQMLSKQDQMLGLQSGTNSEIHGLRRDLKSYLDSRFMDIQEELADIKSALKKAGIQI